MLPFIVTYSSILSVHLSFKKDDVFWEFHANRINAPIYRFENKLYFCRQVGYMSPFCHRWYFLRVGLLVVTFFSVMY